MVKAARCSISATWARCSCRSTWTSARTARSSRCRQPARRDRIEGVASTTSSTSSETRTSTLSDIAAAVGTPCYVYDAGAIRGAYATLDRAFDGYPHAIHYALKANSSLAIVRLVQSLG